MIESGGRKPFLFFLGLDGINEIYSTNKNKVLDIFVYMVYSMDIRLIQDIERNDKHERAYY